MDSRWRRSPVSHSAAEACQLAPWGGRLQRISSRVEGAFLGGDISVVIGREGGWASVSCVAWCLRLFWFVESGPLSFPRLSRWDVGGERTGLVLLRLMLFVSELLWDPLLAFTAVGDIAAVTVGEGGLVMMYLSARRRVFTPFRSLGFGLVGIGGRLGQPPWGKSHCKSVRGF